MKHELPIVIVLLAIACLPWIWQHGETLSASQATQLGEPLELSSVDAQNQDWDQPAFTPEAMRVVPQSTAGESSEFLRSVSRELSNAEPSIARFEIENNLFDSSFRGSGKLWCSGQGLGRSRLELIPDSEDAMITQVCDGRFVYRLVEHGDHRQLKFYDLEKLGLEDLSGAGVLPANWQGFNSLSGLLSSLANTFRFEPMKSSANGRQVEIVGSWNLQHLATLMVDHVDHRSISPTPDWSKIPAQIPHAVRLRFEDVAGQWQVRELLFFRFNEKNPVAQSKASLLVRVSRLQHQRISADLFQLDNSDVEDVSDETESYLKRVNTLRETRRVAERAVVPRS